VNERKGSDVGGKEGNGFYRALSPYDKASRRSLQKGAPFQIQPRRDDPSAKPRGRGGAAALNANGPIRPLKVVFEHLESFLGLFT